MSFASFHSIQCTEGGNAGAKRGGGGRWALCEHVAQLSCSDGLARMRTCHLAAVLRCMAEIVFCICGRSVTRLPDGGKDDNRL